MATPINPSVIQGAIQSERIYGVPASLSIAQFILESDYGKKCPGNNPFGIKAMTGYETQILTTKEFINGKMITVKAGFAKFKSLADAMNVHGKLIGTSKYYARAREQKTKIDYIRETCKVYATDPNYFIKIQSIISKYDLGKYDKDFHEKG